MHASFAKAHAVGNTYVVLSEPAGCRLTGERVRHVCSSDRGVDAHGVVASRAVQPFCVRVYNADGSRAETSGNGLRIYGWWIVVRGLWAVDTPFCLRSMGRQFRVIVRGRVPATVGVGLGRPETSPLRGSWWRVFPDLRGARYVRVGNPHCCFETVGSVEGFPLEELAAVVEQSGRFPGGVNVEVFERATSLTLHVRIWERGVGETPSSGSGSTAAAVAAWYRGTAGNDLQVIMPGGRMEVQKAPDGQVWSWGIVEEICRGELVLP
jgi:diaminopimelate epimerase